MAPVAAFLIVMTLQLLIESPWYRALEWSTAVSERHARQRGASWFASERLHRARAMLARRAELERSRTRVRELRKMMAAAKEDNGKTLASFKSAPASPLYTAAADETGSEGAAGGGGGGGGARSAAMGSPSQRSQSFVAEKAAVILATPNLPLPPTEEEEGEEVAGDGSAIAVPGDERAAQGAGVSGTGVRPRRPSAEEDVEGAELEARHRGQVVEGVMEAMVRVVLTVHLNLMYSLRQTGPFLDFDKASKRLEPLGGLPLARLLALSLDELGYFVSTYTHMICYAALVLSHALLCTPATGVAVLFVLAMAALQEPYPARWYWNVTMGYVAVVAGAKVSACFLQSRMCDSVWSADAWVCASLLPSWNAFAGSGSGQDDPSWFCLVDFATLLVLAAHRANMQYRGLWLDVGPSDLIPSPSVLAAVESHAARESGGGDDEGRTLGRTLEADEDVPALVRLPLARGLRQSIEADGHGLHSPAPRSARTGLFPTSGAGGGAARGGGEDDARGREPVGDGLRRRASASSARSLRSSLTQGQLHSPVPPENRGGARGAHGDDAHGGHGAGDGGGDGGLQGVTASSRGPGGRERVLRSMGVEKGWGGRAWQGWLLERKLVWIASSDNEQSDTTGTGVDLYLWIVTPELLALVGFFGGLLSSGSDTGVPNKLQTLVPYLSPLT